MKILQFLEMPAMHLLNAIINLDFLKYKFKLFVINSYHIRFHPGINFNKLSVDFCN